MSDSSEDADGPSLTRVLGWAERYYHLPVLALLVLFMLWNRVRTWERFLQDGSVVFRSNDPWYHFRQTSYTVEHWPSTMPFDPWTAFPTGNASGQFGTLLDQIVATAALIVGLGDPSQGTVALVSLFAPAVLGVLVAVPTYFIGKRLGGRFGGVVAVTVLALESGRFLTLSMVGFYDHHVAETLFQTLAVLAVMVAVSVAARDKPIYEQVRAVDVEPLRGALGWAALAGIAVTLYLWVWPFGALILGILGVYFVVQINAEFLRGESPEHTALVGAVALTITGALLLMSLDLVTFTPTSFSLLQPAFAFAVAAACVFMAWFARTWERRGLATVGYPLAILVVGIVGAALVIVALPGVFDTISGNIVRVFGFWIDPSATGRTVGEVQPLYPRLGLLFDAYGFAVLIAAGAAVWILVGLVTGRTVSAEKTLVVVWAVFMTLATLTQQRFQYYFVVPVAVLAGYAIGEVFGWLDLSFDASDVEIYQVVSVATVVLVLVVPLLIGSSTAVAIGSANGPQQDISAWTESLEWMQDNTPEAGAYGDGSSDLEFYGTYARTDDFEYEDGAYGVISWWDYGHWITQQGQRIPHANPFQQGTSSAANFLLAPNETQADDVLEGIDEDPEAKHRYAMVDWKMANSYTSQSFWFLNQRWGNRPNGKFFAPIQFYDAGDVQQSDYFQTIYYETEQLGFGAFNVHEQAFYESQVIRLYEYHGSAAEPEPIVVEWAFQERQGRQLPMTNAGQGERALRSFETVEEARSYAENNSNARVGGIGALPSERVPALEHYRLVSTSDASASEAVDYRLTKLTEGTGTDLTQLTTPGECTSDVSLQLQEGISACIGDQQMSTLHQTAPQWTKVFERVPGARVEGSGPANATVRGQVEMYNPAANETFRYHQVTETDEDGSFTMTVPYSTTGYEEWAPENGHTNVSVRATGEYTFEALAVENDTVVAYNGTTEVTEGAVLNDDADPVTVELTEVEEQPGGGLDVQGRRSDGDDVRDRP